MPKGNNCVAIDLARHPDVQYAVIYCGQLLPMRFGSSAEADRHLVGMEAGIVVDHSDPEDQPLRERALEGAAAEA